MTSPTLDDPLAAARLAADRHAWQEAYEGLVALDGEHRLDAAGLELLGEMAWWVHQPETAVAARERAYSAYVDQGDRVRAAFMALLAAQDHQAHLSEAVARGWWARAGRILANEPESFAHGYLRVFESLQALAEGDFGGAEERAALAVDIGARFGDRDVQGLGLICQGAALIRRGETEQGLLLLDEATAAAVAGEFSPYVTGVVYCHTISTCRDLADYRRAGQWTEVAERWCERQSISGFPGVCRVHRAEILALRGDWNDAEQEARRASEELLSFKASPQAAEGYYTLGDIRLRMGDLEGADEAFRLAQDLGHQAQPGRSLLYLAQGRVDAATAAIERALGDVPADRLARARMLPARVEIALAVRNLDAARAAAAELAAIAADFGSPALRAAAHCALGSVYVAANEPDLALNELTRARASWQSVDAPYELARTRGTVAAALRLRGEVDEATAEATAARATFARLGAAADTARCDRLLEELRGRIAAGERQRRTFVFTDIVGSTELVSVIGDEAWNDLKRWHDQTLRAVVAERGGEEVNEAGDGFFFAFRDVRSAVDAAVGIQRELAEHRRRAGFAPRIRIGIHAADATRVAESYVGQGVHEAARIGALAGAGEILVSASTIAEESIVGIGARRAVALKGIPGTVEVHTVDWA